MKCLSNAAVAATVVVCVAGMAAPAFAQDRMPVSATVAYADLNLASVAGKASFERRVRSAANRICGGGSRDLSDVQDSGRCRDEVARSGRQQFATLTTGRDVQVASRGAMTVASK